VSEIKVPVEQLKEGAREVNIYDVTDFLKCPMFGRHYTLRGDVIIKEF
jgi:hypothetical protein